jgi:hypothetical protein
MVFSSEVFLFGFLPAVLALYFVMPGARVKNAFLVVASPGSRLHLPQRDAQRVHRAASEQRRARDRRLGARRRAADRRPVPAAA